MRRALFSLGVVASLGGCSGERVVTLDVTTGHEVGAFQADPPVTRVFVDTYAPEGLLAVSEAAPGGTFTVGELTTDTLARFEVRGLDADGTVQVRGRSLSVLLGSIEGDAFPVFAQRVERWSRPPGGLDHGHRNGTAAVLGERYLVLTGGEGLGGQASQVAFYDLLTLQGLPGGVLSFVPDQVLPSANGRALLALSPDRATWIDFDSGQTVAPVLPAGLGGWADVIGGDVVQGLEATYLVGATRRGSPPSDAVLVVEADGNLRTGRLRHPRSGAAATWVEDAGLVVAGGSATAPGVEVLAYEAGDALLEAQALPFAPDPTVGATGVATGPEALSLLCGAVGDEPALIRDLDLRGCTSDCAPVTSRAALAGPRLSCRAFERPGGVLVVGEDTDGWLRASALDEGAGETSLPLRAPRRDAAVVVAPNGTLAVLGGVDEDGAAALSVELLFPRE